MSPIIPFSGLITDILAAIAILTRWGGPFFGWVIGLSILKAILTNSLAEQVKRQGMGNIPRRSLLITGLTQDALIAGCILALLN
jgi:hypothetical protein